MYGKLFTSLFTGSMRGKGDLQLVWAYMISNATEEGDCDFMPQCISDATGKPLEIIEACLRELESPDPLSRTRTDDGRRIRLINTERPWGWHLVNFEMYRNIATREAMKDAERLRKRAYREKKNESSLGLVRDTSGRSEYDSASDSALNSSGGDARGGGSVDHDFDAFWAAYPRRVGKIKAWEEWQRIKAVRPPIAEVIAAIEAQKKTAQWREKDGQYIPHPTTWLHQGRWSDDPTVKIEKKESAKPDYESWKKP